MKRLIILLIVGVSLMAIRVKADTLTSGYIKTHDGEKIHYVRKGTGTPLILLHGNGQSASYFKPQMDLGVIPTAGDVKATSRARVPGFGAEAEMKM